MSKLDLVEIDRIIRASSITISREEFINNARSYLVAAEVKAVKRATRAVKRATRAEAVNAETRAWTISRARRALEENNPYQDQGD